MNNPIAAHAFAYAAHLGQKYGDVEYIVHPEQVVGVLREFGFVGDDIISAGYLHDVLEDTKVTYTDLVAYFDVGIAALVQAVTNEPGPNRRERHERTYPKIREHGSLAVALKLADRIANVRASIRGAGSNAKSKLKMYRGEYPQFRAMLFQRLDPALVLLMWAELDRLLDWDAKTYTFKGEAR